MNQMNGFFSRFQMEALESVLNGMNCPAEAIGSVWQHFDHGDDEGTHKAICWALSQCLHEPEFVPDSNEYGPFIDGRCYQTGFLFADSPRWEEVRNPETGFWFRRPAGRHAPAERLNGVVRQTGEWLDA